MCPVTSEIANHGLHGLHGPDPRPDLAADSAAWSHLLRLAFDTDGHDPLGCYGVLDGLRCCGAGLERTERGGWKLVAGAMDPNEYAADRERWLISRRREIAELLRRLEQHR
jgi:hypothetical protein